MRLALGDTQFVPPDPGVSTELAQSACEQAGGKWHPPGGMVQYGDCELNTGANILGWCGWVPFATSLFDTCKLPATPADLTTYGSYTAYKTGQKPQAACTASDGSTYACTGAEAEAQQIAQDTQQSTDLLSSQDCSYWAAANAPGLSQVLGPDLAGMLANPFGRNCKQGFPGWILYVGLGLAAYLVFMKK